MVIVLGGTILATKFVWTIHTFSHPFYYSHINYIMSFPIEYYKLVNNIKYITSVSYPKRSINCIVYGRL